MKTNIALFAALAILAPTSSLAGTWFSSGLPSDDGDSGQKSTHLKLKLRIAVNQGKWERLQYQSTSLGSDTTRALQSMIVDKLTKSGEFVVMEREDTAMDANQQEANIASQRRQQIGDRATGMTERETTIPADYIITPEIIGFQVTSRQSSGFNVGPVHLGGGGSSATVKLAFRISSAESSEVIDSAEGEGKAKGSSAAIGVNLGIFGAEHGEEKQSFIGDAVSTAIDKAVDDLENKLGEMPWKAKVAMVTKTGSVVLNRGSNSGLTQGMRLEVFDTSEAVIDPDTGKKISEGDETKLAELEIFKLTPEAAYCHLVSGAGVKRGQMVHPK